jgi:predicted acylesterase/phospholipase RssA
LSAETTPETQAVSPTQDGEVVCFTAGTEVAAFGGGTIHAYLAMNRPAPAIVAGISSGALAAAAMRKSFVELHKAQETFGEGSPRAEAARWGWFRSYLERLCYRPFDVIWAALPDQSDFFADHPPIYDASIQEKDGMAEAQTAAQAQRYRLVQLGRWLIHLSVRVQYVAEVAVAFVRFKERYGASACRRGLHLVASLSRLLQALLWHLAAHPTCYRPVLGPRGKQGKRRPFLGYPIWLAACFFFVAEAAAVSLAVAFIARWLKLLNLSDRVWWLWGAGVLGPLTLAAVLVSTLRLSRWTTASVAGGIGGLKSRLFRAVLHAAKLDQALLSDFHLRLALTELFDGELVPLTNEPGPHPVFVAAPLQSIFRDGKPEVARQLWARPQAPVVDAVLTAMALPGFFEPTDLSEPPEIWKQWLETSPDKKTHLQLIDGAAIRQNPLPALFRYLRDHPDLSARLATGPIPSVHVVYSVPIEPLSDRDTVEDADTTVVDVGRAALRLARRCDTQLEVMQTNFMTQLLELVPQHHRSGVGGKRLLALRADEIAPDPLVKPLGGLSWDPVEVRRTVASGCKRTLQVLYAEKLQEQQAGQATPTHCRGLAIERRPNLDANAPVGLPEVCAECDGIVAAPRAAPPSAEVCMEAVQGKGVPVGEFPQLLRDKPGQPRIVLVASGGVFRGAFHAGMAGAMWIANAKPDLVVGASVGTLMGGVVAAMFQEPRLAATTGLKLPKQLVRLIDTFLRVDKKIALTMTLKTAARELGLRGRAIGLSPVEVRKAVLRGSRADAGYAATGAPPVLIDALSDLLMIPRTNTAALARRFTAGNVTGAVGALGDLAKRHTLRRLGIESAVMGASLIRNSAEELLTFENADLKTHQPYQAGNQPIAFFATATDLGKESLFWLGDSKHLPGAPYDFVQGALASSAFPFVFAPRRESELYPGVGNRDRRFSDGGIFDNLPFIPALKILADAQVFGPRSEHLADTHDPVVEDHLAFPDLFIVGALNANPEEAANKTQACEGLLAVIERAAQLKNNVKIRGFQRTSASIAVALKNANHAPQPPEAREFLRRVVNAAILPIFPSDEDHINPTFAFCASMGLDRTRVAKSIANGCFQSLNAFGSLKEAPELTNRSIQKLRDEGRIALIERREKIDGSVAKDCPYFLKREPRKKTGGALGAEQVTPFACPFALAKGESTTHVHALCIRDPVHHKAWAPAGSEKG